VRDTKRALRSEGLEAVGRGVVTLAYYPDGIQEKELARRGLDRGADGADLMHAMSYDAPGPAGHSPMQLALDTVQRARAAGLDIARVTLGLPFYARHSSTGDWVSWEDVLKYSEAEVLARGAGDHVAVVGDLLHTGPSAYRVSGSLFFNSPSTIEAKVRLAIEEGLGGVMIWESGQDCRVRPVTRDGATHVRTCPGEGDAASLHSAITRAMKASAAGGNGGRVAGAGGEL
jgi:Glycosyl hydrolases family 18